MSFLHEKDLQDRMRHQCVEPEIYWPKECIRTRHNSTITHTKYFQIMGTFGKRHTKVRKIKEKHRTQFEDQNGILQVITSVFQEI